jgi:hypothetical protein
MVDSKFNVHEKNFGSNFDVFGDISFAWPERSRNFKKMINSLLGKSYNFWHQKR